jgi:hypothetical protein
MLRVFAFVASDSQARHNLTLSIEKADTLTKAMSDRDGGRVLTLASITQSN